MLCEGESVQSVVVPCVREVVPCAEIFNKCTLIVC